MKRYPIFIVRNAEGRITNMFQPSLIDHTNFRMVYGIARDWKEEGGSVQIASIIDDKITE